MTEQETRPVMHVSDDLAQAAANDGIELRFREHGDAYERARMVADRLGLDMKTFLLLCIKEGHAVLKRRAGLAEPQLADLDTPAVLRRPPPAGSRERADWERVRALFE